MCISRYSQSTLTSCKKTGVTSGLVHLYLRPTLVLLSYRWFCSNYLTNVTTETLYLSLFKSNKVTHIVIYLSVNNPGHKWWLPRLPVRTVRWTGWVLEWPKHRLELLQNKFLQGFYVVGEQCRLSVIMRAYGIQCIWHRDKVWCLPQLRNPLKTHFKDMVTTPHSWGAKTSSTLGMKPSGPVWYLA